MENLGLSENWREEIESSLELIVKESLEHAAKVFKIQLVFSLPCKHDDPLICI